VTNEVQMPDKVGDRGTDQIVIHGHEVTRGLSSPPLGLMTLSHIPKNNINIMILYGCSARVTGAGTPGDGCCPIPTPSG
jgi:hypothetical protein